MGWGPTHVISRSRTEELEGIRAGAGAGAPSGPAARSHTPTFLSLPDARMLVSALVLHTLIFMSPALTCCPTHWFSYT